MQRWKIFCRHSVRDFDTSFLLNNVADINSSRGAGHYKALVGQGGYYGKNGIKVAKGGNAEGRAKAKQHPYTGKPGVHGHHRV